MQASDIALALPRVVVGGASMCRIIHGMWQAKIAPSAQPVTTCQQVSGGFGDADVNQVVEAMLECYEHGYNTFDLSPNYGAVRNSSAIDSGCSWDRRVIWNPRTTCGAQIRSGDGGKSAWAD